MVDAHASHDAQEEERVNARKNNKKTSSNTQHNILLKPRHAAQPPHTHATPTMNVIGVEPADRIPRRKKKSKARQKSCSKVINSAHRASDTLSDRCSPLRRGLFVFSTWISTWISTFAVWGSLDVSVARDNAKNQRSQAAPEPCLTGGAVARCAYLCV